LNQIELVEESPKPEFIGPSHVVVVAAGVAGGYIAGSHYRIETIAHVSCEVKRGCDLMVRGQMLDMLRATDGTDESGP
jgi:hypothetical protein